MEKEMEVRISSAPAREIGVITAEIKELCRRMQSTLLVYAVEIGRRLDEAKRALPHGQWAEWLSENVEFSQRQANNFMKLYEEYGADQLTLFGAALNSQTFANFPYSKALLLLAVPSEEREEFAEEVHAEELSVRELKDAIAERDKYKKALDAQVTEGNNLRDKLVEAEKAKNEALARAAVSDNYKRELENVTASADELRKKLEKAEKDPKIPKDKLDKLRAEAEAAAKKKADAEAKAEIKLLEQEADHLKTQVDAAEAEARRAVDAEKAARASLADAERRLKTASPEVAAFKALFEDIQIAAARLKTMIETVRDSDPETADKLGKALKAFGASL